MQYAHSAALPLRDSVTRDISDGKAKVRAVWKALQAWVEDDLKARRAHLERLDRIKAAQLGPTPDWQKPPYNSQDYRDAVYLGWITPEVQERDGLLAGQRSQRARETTWRQRQNHNKGCGPGQDGQYAEKMSTHAARNRNLPGNAPSLLQVLVALCGKRGHYFTTNTYLAKRLGVHPDTIRRWRHALRDAGYIVEHITQNRMTRMVEGVLVQLTALCFPAFLKAKWAKILGNPAPAILRPKNPYGYNLIIKYSVQDWKNGILDPLRYCQVPI